MAFIDHQQALAQDSATLQSQAANTADKAIRLAVFDNAFENGWMPLADLTELFENPPNRFCGTVNHCVVVHLWHNLFPHS
nr:hypothetical protein [Pectobacterium odoriferum]